MRAIASEPTSNILREFLYLRGFVGTALQAMLDNGDAPEFVYRALMGVNQKAEYLQQKQAGGNLCMKCGFHIVFTPSRWKNELTNMFSRIATTSLVRSFR